jgi:hypothetical protein
MIRALIAAVLGIMVSVIACSAGAAPRIAEGEVLRGRFVQERHLKGFAAPLRSEGQFLLAPGRGLIWKTEMPFAVTTVITEAGLVQEVNGNQTLNMPAAKLPFLSRLYQMLGGALAGDWQALESDFALAREGDENNWQLGLKPKKADDMAMPFRSIAVSGTRFVNEVTLTKPDGDFDKLTFLDQVLSATPLAADESLALDSVGR